MRDVSQRWADNADGVNKWKTVVEYSTDGGQNWSGLDVIEGSVEADATSKTRWSCDLTLAGNVDDITGATRVRVKHGPEWADRDELINMGLYRVDSVERETGDDQQIHISGSGKESYLINADYERPEQFHAEHADERLRKMIHDVLPAAQIYWDKRLDEKTLMPKTIIEKDRWGAIDGDSDDSSIARALGARVYADAAGVFRVEPVPRLADDIVWRAESGQMLIKSTESKSGEDVVNVVVASGESTSDSGSVVRGVAEDTDPLSDTYVGRSPDEGGFGRKPKFYSSENLAGQRWQAVKAAEAILAFNLGTKRKVEFDSIHDPRKEPGDVGLVETVSGMHRVILDSVTYDLKGDNLQCGTRTTPAATDEEDVIAGGEYA